MNVRGFDPGLGTRIQGAAGPEKPSVLVGACNLSAVDYFIIHHEKEVLCYRMRRGERVGFAPNSLPFPERRINSLLWQKNSLLCLHREFTRN